MREDLTPLLLASWRAVTRAAGARETVLSARRWIERQLVTHDDWVALGWCDYREGQLDSASTAFEEGRRRVRHSPDAATGLGYVALRRFNDAEALRQFTFALRHAPASRDASAGLEIALQRLPVHARGAVEARDVARTAFRKLPGREDLLYTMVLADMKSGGTGELRRRPDAGAGSPAYFARAGVDYLELRGADGDWRPVFVKGVNLGPALPGRFASEQPEDVATWQDWLGRIAGLGANAVRVYTLQPPAFYTALERHNRDRPDATLWLLQGVWTELPPDDDFAGTEYLRELHRSIERVIDAVHGDLVLAPERGNARGRFETDVSRYTLAWIIGREWEPFAVVAFEQMQPGPCSYAGHYVSVSRARAMECWIGGTLDHAAAYEARRFGQLRPLTFANWPTLDPLAHPTEATRAEEDAWRSRLTGTPIPQRSSPAWDDDAVSVDATLLEATGSFPPGVFASYHVYPNFPYFMNLEPAYAGAADAEGVLRYAGYLAALKAHHGRQPVLVAEFGMSTSRGIAHLQPEGLHHGGHDEREAMAQNVRLLEAIGRERMAGAVAFEFMDEWFKGTWSTNPFELPEEHRPRWFNAESPEQSYGLYAARPASPVRVDGDPGDWSDATPMGDREPAGTGWSDIRKVRATYDSGWLYLLLETTGRGPVDWSQTSISIGLDTYDAGRGERRLPEPAGCDTPTGVEFAVKLAGPGASELVVTPTYRLRHPAESGAIGLLASPAEPTGEYASLRLETNRERYTRAGERIPSLSVMPGRLRFGTLDPARPGYDSRTDVAIGADAGAIELRLPWALLSFADPSSGRVLHSPARTANPGTTPTSAIHVYACGVDARAGDPRRQAVRGPDVRVTLPLENWVQPEFVLEPKQGLELLVDAFRRIDVPAAARTSGAGS